VDHGRLGVDEMSVVVADHRAARSPPRRGVTLELGNQYRAPSGIQHKQCEPRAWTRVAG